jgi:shikimate kinase
MQIEMQCSDLNEVIRAFRRQSIETLRERYFIAGPCGIGKTTLGKLLSEELKLRFIDHDEMKEKVNHYPYPCSVSKLNIAECLRESLVIEGNPNSFIFAAGGDSIFRVGADNDARLLQLSQVKENYAFVVVVLIAEETILEQRYLQVGTRDKENFSNIWNNWINVEQPYWEKCADYIVDTSDLVL